MSKATDISKAFDISLKKLQGDNLWEGETNEILRGLSERLKLIIAKHPGEPIMPEDKSLLRAISLFIKSRGVSNTEIPRSVLKNLSFAMEVPYSRGKTILKSASHTKELLELLNSNWSDRYFTGLFRSLLSTWEDKPEGQKELRNFVINQLNGYKGKRHRILVYKRNLRYISDELGPLTLGEAAQKKNMPISSIPSLMGLDPSDYSYSFFTESILEFIRGNKNMDLPFLKDLSEILSLHNRDLTSKQVISRLIKKADIGEVDAKLQDPIKDLAVEHIGDPDQEHLWAPPRQLPLVLKTEIRDANKILKKWITQRFISVFFEKCINEKRRKKFWLKMVDNISDFWVAGSRYTLEYKLRGDDRVADLLDSRFNLINRNTEVSALFMRINKHIIIEFSDKSYACYAYLSNSKAAPAKSDQIHDLSELRDGSMPKAAYYQGDYITESYDEGRLFHTGSWEQIFDYWFKTHALNG